ncbi:MAG: alanyl-tRNA editing protein [Lachnospiraceae bacterium]|jgi:alanyl-tRNA synthetase
MTKKLFYEDSHLQEFSAVVETCEKVKNGYAIVLDQTVFFPEGGGQEGDTGYLNEVEITDTQEKDAIIYHIGKQPIETGTTVRGKLTYEERFDRMQQHSGEHIVSGLVHHYFQYNNVGFHLGKELVTMDFDGVLTPEDLQKIEWEANEAVAANLPVQISYPDKEALKQLSYRSKIEIPGQVRLVTIPGYDVCACCAPHVKQTGEIGLVKITGMIHYKGGTRVTMLCGFRALSDYRKKEENVSRISVLLSAKLYETADSVEKLYSDYKKAKEKTLLFQENWLKEKLNSCTEEGKPVLLFALEGDMNVVRKVLLDKLSQSKGICGAFIGEDKTGYHYILVSEEMDLREFSRKMHQALPGKGGGKSQMVQGSVNAAEKQIRDWFFAV